VAILDIMISPTDDAPTELAATDPDALARLERFGGRKLLHEMITLFLENASDRLATADAGVGAGDASAAEHAMHTLKASSAQLGALRLARLCEEGESIARRGTVTGLAAVLQESRYELRRVESWLANVRAEGET
jgi:HPt (histidine-containing phosphotransfer) domain-containing protein